MQISYKTLPASLFSRVHRSFIVNVAKVRILERNCIVFGKKLIPISDVYRESVLLRLDLK